VVQAPAEVLGAAASGSSVARNQYPTARAAIAARGSVDALVRVAAA
jgi:hypothetical protein